MGYTGQQVSFQPGVGGLLTDDAPNKIPEQNLIDAKNVTIIDGILEKEPGSMKWNITALGDDIVALYDWWPKDGLQRMIAVTKGGKVYRFTDRYSYSEVTSTNGAPLTLTISEQVCIVECGQELPDRNKKLLIFTGNNPIQVIEGDVSVRRNMSKPAADWVDTFPTFGILHLGLLWVFGNQNCPHRIYGSNPDDHEDFQTLTKILTAEIYPGYGNGLISGFVFKGQLFVLKNPSGFFTLKVQDIGTLSTTSYFELLNDKLGAASLNSYVELPDDVLVANSNGGISTLSATFNLGNITAANILLNMKIEKYLRENTAQTGLGRRFGIYYDAGKRFYFSFRSKTDLSKSVSLIGDFNGGTPRFTLSDKDNTSCFAMVKDIDGVRRPFYGSTDGFIYQMDKQDRLVGASGFTGLFQTPHSEMGFADNKNFDFLEICYVPTGNWDLDCDVVIDGKKTETITFDLGKGNQLPASGLPDYYLHFKLDATTRGQLGGNIVSKIRRPIHGRGRTISFKFSNDGSNQNFKIEYVTVSYRQSSVEEKT